MFGLIFIALLLALITGVIGFGGFIAGATGLLIVKVLFFIFLLTFFFSLLGRLFAGPSDKDHHHHK
jgi:uncharacterized membrane protein YtjA (UPF0391 family)